MPDFHEDTMLAPPPPDTARHDTAASQPVPKAGRGRGAPAKAAAKSQQANRRPAPPTATQSPQPTGAGPGQGFAQSPQQRGGVPRTIVVFLDKSAGGSLGLEVVQDARGRVLIQAVSGGLASQWNAENFESQIEPGDCIAGQRSDRRGLCDVGEVQGG